MTENYKMLPNRMRNIDATGIIYHYCSPDAFIEILKNRTIRFSDLNMLNDAEEGRWGYKVFEIAATKILKREETPELISELPKEFIDKIDEVWSGMGLAMSSFVSCFSNDGDSLSQWRAYADDGRGFAIGFDVAELRRLPIQMLDILYDQKQQIHEMVIAIGAIYLEYMDRGQDHKQSWFFQRCATLAASAISFKNPAWRDEQEVRCHHLVDVRMEETHWKLVDVGGSGSDEEVKGQPIEFQVRGGSITPYLDMPFEVSEKRQPIAEIVFGPKCQNAYGNILFLLGNLGFGLIPLRTAGAAYR